MSSPCSWRCGTLSRLLAVAFLVGLRGTPLLAQPAAPPHPDLFRIEVVDAETGRGVPLVELTTVNQVRFVTDSAGHIAIADPDLLGEEVWFSVRSHGYLHPADGFGFRGVRLSVRPGHSARLPLPRLNIARRLYRVTGGGLYADTARLGLPVPVQQPLGNARVVGQDSVLAEVFDGRVHWFWGDTNRPAYPLGNFHVPGATSQLPTRGGLPIERGIDLTYWANADGFARETARLPGEGPTWLAGLAVLPDRAGRERMFAGSMKVRNLLEVYARGLVEWNPATAGWELRREIPLATPCYPIGHMVRIPGAEPGWLGFAHPFPWVRIPAEAEAFLDPDRWEAFTCLREGSPAGSTAVDRDPAGRPVWGWKKQTAPVWSPDAAKLVRDRHLDATEVWAPLVDVETNQPVVAHAGSTHWNEFRQKYVLIANQLEGSRSFLGEVWYSEAATPLGPWSHAVRVATHEKYSFYNPRQHPFFDTEGGRQIVFEGTYATTFSGNSDPTPRYDYNQILYQLDLADPRLALPVPLQFIAASEATGPPQAVWQATGRGFAAGEPGLWREAVGYAPDRHRPGCLPAVWQPTGGEAGEGGGWRLSLREEGPAAGERAAGFWGWPLEDRPGIRPPAGLTWLIEIAKPGEPIRYETRESEQRDSPKRNSPKRDSPERNSLENNPPDNTRPESSTAESQTAESNTAKPNQAECDKSPPDSTEPTTNPPTVGQHERRIARIWPNPWRQRSRR